MFGPGDEAAGGEDAEEEEVVVASEVEAAVASEVGEVGEVGSVAASEVGEEDAWEQEAQGSLVELDQPLFLREETWGAIGPASGRQVRGIAQESAAELGLEIDRMSDDLGLAIGQALAPAIGLELEIVPESEIARVLGIDRELATAYQMRAIAAIFGTTPTTTGTTATGTETGSTARDIGTPIPGPPGASPPLHLV